MLTLTKHIYRRIVPLALRRSLSEARLRRKVRRGELVHLHVHYPAYDVSPQRIDLDVHDAIENGLTYARQIAAVTGRASKPFPDLRGMQVLEVGPGLGLGSLLVCCAAGAQATAVDAFAVQWHEAYHPAYYRRLGESALQRWPERDWSAIDAVIESRGGGEGSALRVVAGDIGGDGLREFADRSFDAAVSNAALEHILDLSAAARELARITRPGGAGVHLVDFRHHCDPDRPLAFLTISDRRYERLLERRQGREGNRIRASELKEMFAAAGFEVRRLDVIDRADEEYVQRLRPRMLPRFAALETHDLAILSARISLERSG